MGVHPHAGGVEEQVEGAPFPAAESLQFLIGVHLQAEVPIPPPAQVGGHFLGQGHRFGLGALPAGDGQVQIPLAGGRLESQGPGGAAVAQQQHPAGKIAAVVFQGLVAAGAVGGEAQQLALFHLDGVHRAKEPGLFLQAV